jgi:hypothetical protein
MECGDESGIRGAHGRVHQCRQREGVQRTGSGSLILSVEVSKERCRFHLMQKGVMDNFYGGKGVRDEFLSSTKLLDFVPDTILIFL